MVVKCTRHLDYPTSCNQFATWNSFHQASWFKQWVFRLEFSRYL